MKTHELGRREIRTQCRGKNYYGSKREAVTVANFQTGKKGARKGQRHGRPEYLRAYHCDQCSGWHLTKRESWDE